MKEGVLVNGGEDVTTWETRADKCRWRGNERYGIGKCRWVR